MSTTGELEAVKLMMKGLISELSEEGKAAFETESKIFDDLLFDVKTKIEGEDDQQAAATVIAAMIFLADFGQLIESEGAKKL